nr:hypothetical protein [uncultured Butyrivibrio sp.]
MSVGILSNVTSYSNMYTGKSSWGESASKSTSGPSIENTEGSSSDMLRKLEYNRWKQEKKSSVVEQSVSYADQLKASRKKSKEITNEKKKLQYSFKKISSQIIRSKNSVSARSAVQAAKREVMRLKRLRNTGEYDDEELQLAIDHAKSMEQVARKKAVHLEQEEMVERHQKGFGAALEEIEDKKAEDENENPEELLEEPENIESNEDQVAADIIDEYNVDPQYIPEMDLQYELQQAMEENQYQLEEMISAISENSEQVADTSNQAMTDMMDQMNQAMSEMMEDLDLTELSETLYAPDPNMSEDDLKMLKIKHRAKEMKEIAEADKEYLKGLMEHEKSKAANSSAISTGSSSPSPAAIFGGNTSSHITPVISMPGAAMGGGITAPASSGGFSVSI